MADKVIGNFKSKKITLKGKIRVPHDLGKEKYDEA